ncbi:MAG: hypothetical protein ACRYG4_00240 [Janthinobacterium lividum]
MARPVDPAVARLAGIVAGRFDGAGAVLFYGSCLRAASLDGLMLDFYLVVDDYARAYGPTRRGRFLAAANRLLPPNVFQVEVAGLRAKYAVLSAADLARLAGRATRNPSVWARFAQPSRLVWWRDERARVATVAAVAGAPVALLAAAAPLAAEATTVRDLWLGAFAATYRTELRSERAGRGVALFDAEPGWYRAVTGPALAAAGIAATVDGDAIRFAAPLAGAPAESVWRRRRIEGKALSVARLLKASATFDGGLDYLAWKITRHSGVAVDVRPWQRRWPLLGAIVLLPRLFFRGAVR